MNFNSILNDFIISIKDMFASVKDFLYSVWNSIYIFLAHYFSDTVIYLFVGALALLFILIFLLKIMNHK